MSCADAARAGLASSITVNLTDIGAATLVIARGLSPKVAALHDSPRPPQVACRCWFGSGHDPAATVYRHEAYQGAQRKGS
jgi:hypothetical protein